MKNRVNKLLKRNNIQQNYKMRCCKKKNVKVQELNKIKTMICKMKKSYQELIIINLLKIRNNLKIMKKFIKMINDLRYNCKKN